MAGDLLQKNAIDLVHHRNIYFDVNHTNLPSVEYCSTAKQK